MLCMGCADHTVGVQAIWLEGARFRSLLRSRSVPRLYLSRGLSEFSCEVHLAELRVCSFRSGTRHRLGIAELLKTAPTVRYYIQDVFLLNAGLAVSVLGVLL
jgi:hypothetical protein